MQPEQPSQPTPNVQPQPVPPTQPVQSPEQPTGQPAQPVQQVQSGQQPAFGAPAQQPVSNVQKQIQNAGGSVFALGIFFVILFSLVFVAGIIGSLSNAGEGIITALMSLLYILFGVVLITQGKKLKRETDHVKAGAMMKSMAIGLSVLAVLGLVGGAWMAVVMFSVTAVYLFVTSSTVTKG